jgi:N-sulfoglucosamine sulfohydrolase
MISAVDLMPTVLDIVGIKPPQGFDGHSFLPTIRGQSQPNREMVYKVYNENSGGNRSPMRSVESKKFGYLFNAWSNGERVFKTATTGTMSYRAMQKKAHSDPQIAARLDLFQHGVPEEFYNYEDDPDALHNLIDDPKYATEIAEHRAAMRKFMQDSNDPMLSVFDKRDDPAFVSAYVDQVQAQSDARRKNRRSKKQPAANRKQTAKLFRLELPRQAKMGSDFTVTIKHTLPADLGKQKFHVTLKGESGKRIERKIKSAAGTNTLTVTFQLPPELDSDSVSVSAFVGEDYPSNQQHLTEGPVAVSR